MGAAEVQLHLILTSALDRREWAIFIAWPHCVMGRRSGEAGWAPETTERVGAVKSLVPSREWRHDLSAFQAVA
jgi:hypothetical protein